MRFVNLIEEIKINNSWIPKDKIEVWIIDLQKISGVNYYCES